MCWKTAAQIHDACLQLWAQIACWPYEILRTGFVRDQRCARLPSDTWPLPTRGRFDLDPNVKQSICDRACFPPLLLLCQPDSWAQRGSWQETLTLSATQNHLNPIDPPDITYHLSHTRINTHISVVPATFFSFAFFMSLLFSVSFIIRLYSRYIRQLLRPPCFLHKTSLFRNIDCLAFFFWVAISNICLLFFPSLSLSTLLCAGIIMTEHPSCSHML